MGRRGSWSREGEKRGTELALAGRSRGGREACPMAKAKAMAMERVDMGCVLSPWTEVLKYRGRLLMRGEQGKVHRASASRNARCQSGDMCSDMTLSERIGIGHCAGPSACWVRRQ